MCMCVCVCAYGGWVKTHTEEVLHDRALEERCERYKSRRKELLVEYMQPLVQVGICGAKLGEARVLNSGGQCE